MAVKRRDPAKPPDPAVVVTMAVMLIAFAAFSSGLYRDVTPLRLLLFVSLAGIGLFFFLRVVRTRR